MICWLAAGASSTSRQRRAAQLEHGLLQHHAELPAQRGDVGADQVEHRVDAALVQTRAGLAADAPDVADLGGRITSSSCAARQRAEVAHLRQCGADSCRACGRPSWPRGWPAWPGSWSAPKPTLVGSPVHCSTLARRSRPMRDQVAAHAVEVEEALVDAVDLLARRVLGGQRHHAAGHVAVELEVGRQRDQPRLALQVAHLEPGLRHLDAQVLGLVAARDAGAVVVRQHDHRPADRATAGTPARS